MIEISINSGPIIRILLVRVLRGLKDDEESIFFRIWSVFFTYNFNIKFYSSGLGMDVVDIRYKFLYGNP